MGLPRIALTFDDSIRCDTTGVYCRRALDQIADVERVQPRDLSRLVPEQFDWLIAIDDGSAIHISSEWRGKAAFWAIDTHIDFQRVLEIAQQTAYVFGAQRNGVERLRAAGILSTEWLPLACDPEIHGRQRCPPQFDVAFVGNRFPGRREEFLKCILERYPVSFVGNNTYFKEMAAIYSAARIAFNCSVVDDVNMRVFEGLCAGSLLLTNDLSENGQDLLFVPGRHLATYHNKDELFDRLAWYLRHDAIRERVAAQGRAEVLARHTYRHRMQAMLQSLEQQRLRNGKAISLPSKTAVSKESSYYAHARPELMQLVPITARRILDVGCGTGRLGAALKQRQSCTVTGIECNPGAAESAQARIDRVFVADIESDNLGFEAADFDCVICGDILEHLQQPQDILARIADWLSPDGLLVASIPNVRHHSVVHSLLAGNWTYEPAGLLDDDHVRFFTRREIEKLLYRSGFLIENLQSTNDQDHQNWVARGRPSTVESGSLRFQTRSSDDAEEFYTYQFLLTARPVVLPRYGLTSIIIVTFNELACTRECLQSLRMRTTVPYELIVVDNGSTDGTAEWLDRQPDVTLIRNEENLGFPAAVNLGRRAASGDQFLILNNDTVLTTGWLRRLLDVMRSDSKIGLVGPVTNHISGPQQIPVDYRALEELDGFAWDWGKQNAGNVMALDRLVGFCILISRRGWDAVGDLDERFGIGCFEDDDYCHRARLAGFRTVVARDCFIHHHGSQTFRGSGIDLRGLLQENEAKFREKWKEQPEPLPASPMSNVSIDSGPQSSNHRLSLCMIVRDNERTIQAALESIRPWVDEMVVVDTGSQDRTPEICRELGARVFEFPWIDDFSAARNESLSKATGDWIFWMDSDDTIPSECGRKLRDLIDRDHPREQMGYVMQVHCPSADNARDITVVDHVKLIRNRPDLRFEHRIHEQILPAIRRAGGDVSFTEIYVVHSGSDQTPKGHQRKLERDFRLLKLDIQERPNHPFTLFNLGMTYADDKQYESAIQHLSLCLDVSDPSESHVPKAYALLLNSLCQLGRYDEAADVCGQAREQFPDDRELHFRQALLYQQFHRLDDAAKAYREILNKPSERRFQSVDRGLQGHKSRHNLAIVLEELGRPEEAAEQWERIIAEMPDYRPAWRALGDMAMRSGQRLALQELVERIAKTPLTVDSAIFQARLDVLDGRFDAARNRLESTIRNNLDDVDLLRELCQLLFERFGPAEAIGPLQRLVEIAPDGAVYHNLGAAYLALERFNEAIDAFQHSLQLRPDAIATQKLLVVAQQSEHDLLR